MRYWLILSFILPLLIFAKNPKPAILIYGSSMEAYIAALQSANSGVPTLWVNPKSYSFEQENFNFNPTLDKTLLDGGVIQQFINSKDGNTDSTNTFVQDGKKQFYNMLARDNILLTILNSEDVIKIERSKSWKVILSNKKSYEVRVVLDASIGNTLLQKTTLNDLPELRYRNVKDMDLTSSRGLVLVGDLGDDIYVSTLPDLLTQKDNFFVASLGNVDKHVSKSFRMSYGQAMGAIAGYCAFFKTTANKIDLRTLQNELLMFRSRLLPTIDVSFRDKNYMSIQRVFLAGILPLRIEENKNMFDSNDSVRVADIKSVVNQYYSRAQLWFVDNDTEYLTVQDALNLIKFTAFRGEELDVEIKKKWNKELTFKSEFEPSKAISRYEFAVLFDKYAAPFIKRVSQDGATINR